MTVPTTRTSMPGNRSSASAADGPGELGNFGHCVQEAFLRQFDGDVDDADITVQSQDGACDPRI